ncbi:MAG: Acylphosphatase [Firmicutes bacterium]|nr:Acylphosphatase [Bacillota bacterium]
MKRMRIGVTGIVQGVGFRPFVYNLARRFALAGWVQNIGSGVIIEIEGVPFAVESFVQALKTEVPPVAVLEEIWADPCELKGESDFIIRKSEAKAERQVFVSPDVATCADCQREITDPKDRRYRYPFTNCTNCGPRYTIITGTPYDREQTTMAEFTMCSTCREEYQDPSNRRFHAQPNACPECGPSYRLFNEQKEIQSGEPIETARQLIAAT